MAVSKYSLKPLPAWLWYEKSISAFEWTSTHLGHPNTSRIIGGHTQCYKNPFSAVTQEKRKLFLTDWSAEQWNAEKIAEVKEWFLYLMAEGFEIFVWQNDAEDSFVTLTADNIGLLDYECFRQSITPILPQELIKRAYKHKNISSDAMGILNVVRIKELLGHDGWIDGPEYYVSLFDVILQSSFNVLTLIEQIKKEHGGICSVDQELKQHWKDENRHLCDSLTFEKCNKSLKLLFPPDRFPEHFDTFNELEMRYLSNQDKHVARDFFKRNHQLRSLELWWEPCMFDFVPHALDNLKALSLNHMKRGAETFVEQLFMYGKNVEVLKYRSSNEKPTFNTKNIALKSQALKNLKSLELDTSVPEECTFFFSQPKKLEKLHLTLLENQGLCVIKPEHIPPNSLIHVKALTITPGYGGNDFWETSFWVLKSILEQASMLESLDLEKVLFPSDIRLEKLKRLRLKNFREIDIKICLGMPYLEVLSFSNGEIKWSGPVWEDLYAAPTFTHLQELTISNSVIPCIVLEEILKKSPNLKFLNIENIKALVDEGEGNDEEEQDEDLNLEDWLNVFTAEDLTLSNLQQLTISRAHITLLDSPSLKEMKINKLIIKEGEADEDECAAYLKILIRKELTLGEVFNLIEETDLHPEEIPIRWPVNFLERLEGFYDEGLSESVIHYIRSHAKNLTKWSLKELSQTNSKSGFCSGSNKAFSQTDVNMNTKQDPNAQYNLIKVFWGVNTPDPHPASYRISVYDRLKLENKISLSNSRKERNELEQGLRPLEHPYYFCDQDTFHLDTQVPLCRGEQCFYGKTSIALNTEWQPLPSLSPQEMLTHFHVPGIKKENIELKYSEEDRLHYVRMHVQPYSGMPKTVDIDFLLKTVWPLDRSGQHCSPLLQMLVQKYKMNLGEPGLPPGATDNSSRYGTDAAILKALLHQHLIGACRHRAIAFKYAVGQCIHFGQLPSSTDVRIVHNDCHAYIEVEEGSEQDTKGNRERITIDLGGHPSAVKISNKNAPRGLSTATETASLSDGRMTAATLSEIQKQQELKKIACSPFNTWTLKASQTVNLQAYAQQILGGFSVDEPNKEIYNHLVQFDSKEAIENFRLYLQAECLNHPDKEVYYIDSPEDLICSSNWIERVGDIGIPRGGPGGPLHTFLTYENFRGENKKTPLVIVNLNNFKRPDTIKFNALYDLKERRADGTLLPRHTRVIGLLFNINNPAAYKGDDFFRRWYVNTLPAALRDVLSQEDAVKSLKNIFKEKAEALQRQETVMIDLYESIDWKEMLLGRWVLDGKSLSFEEGKLIAALENAKAENMPLEIKNGLWKYEAFRTFWQQEKLSGRLEGVEFVHGQGYDWAHVCEDSTQTVTWNRVAISPPDEMYVLNPTLLSKFLFDYVFKPSDLGIPGPEGIEGDLFKSPGWLQTHQKPQPLALYVTRNLSSHQWAEFLETSKKYGVSLDIHLAPHVILPDGLGESERVHVSNDSVMIEPSVYITSDMHFTVSHLQTKHVGCKPINISELESQDLLEHLHPKMRGLEYSFFRTENALLTALKAGETVILKGKFKPEWVDILSSLCIPGAHIWINGERIILPGKVLLVSEDEQAFQFTSVIKEKDEDIQIYKKKLIEEIQAQQKETAESLEQKNIHEWLNTRSVVQLESSLRYVQATGHDPRVNWDGFVSISENKTMSPKDKDKVLDIQDLSLEASERFKQERYTQIDEVLRGKRCDPFVFIAGSTGVGKSSFIQKELENIAGSPYKVYIGLENIQAWAANTQKADFPVLFIDEANIDAGDFSNYEGLWDKPPHMIIKGKYVVLSEKHKVIFAGNPSSYGSRRTPGLFEDYGNSVVFPPMSPAYVYHQVLKPILNANVAPLGALHAKRMPETGQEQLGKVILDVYQRLVNLSKDKILISPRELEMMALLLITQYQKTGSLKGQDIATIIRTISEPLIPQKDKSHFFEQKTSPDPIVANRILPQTSSTDAFLVTASRRSIDDEIGRFLCLRAFKRNTHEAAIRYAAGLGGIVLEGDPGLGKSEFVINLLAEKGFTEKTFSSEVQRTEPVLLDTSKNYFYKMPVSMQEADKEKLLLQTFHEGSIVVIDEINSGPMMEKLLNAILMGYDLQGNRPVNPGFGIIATQNPASMAGRTVASTALEHRFIKRYFSPYPPCEMEAILQQRGLSIRDAKALVEDYHLVWNYAHQHHKEPAPTFGHLIEEALKRKQQAKIEAEAQAAAWAQAKTTAWEQAKAVIWTAVQPPAAVWAEVQAMAWAAAEAEAARVEGIGQKRKEPLDEMLEPLSMHLQKKSCPM